MWPVRYVFGLDFFSKKSPENPVIFQLENFSFHLGKNVMHIDWNLIFINV